MSCEFAQLAFPIHTKNEKKPNVMTLYASSKENLL